MSLTRSPRPRIRALISTSLALLTLLVAGCTDDGASTSSNGPSTDGLRIGGHSVSRFPELGDPAVTLVTTPGENPTALRYAFEVGATQDFVVEQRQAGAGQQQSAPALAVPGRAIVKQNDHNVSTLELELELTTGELQIPPARLSVVTDSLARSLSVRTVSSNRDPQLAQVVDAIVEQLVSAVMLFPIALPDEPIGVGGRWEVLQTIEFRGIKVHRALGCELLEVSDDTIRVKTVGVTVSPGTQEASLPSGTKIEIIGASSKSSGEFEINLTRLLPIGSRNAEHQQTTRRVPAEGEEAMEPRVDEIVESYTIRTP